MVSAASHPFGQTPRFESIAGPTYLTTQSLIQQVAYALSDRLFTYSPHTFDLDVLVSQWASLGEHNANGVVTPVQQMQIRHGAGNIALGYMFSKDFDPNRRNTPKGLLATSSSLKYLKPALQELSPRDNLSHPLVAHLSAVDYVGSKEGRLVTDYVSALEFLDDEEFGMVCSTSAYEAQHMALLATALARIVPAFHIYDGVRLGGEITRVIDVLDQPRLHRAYQSIVTAADENVTKRTSIQDRAVKLLSAFNSELGSDYNFFEYSGHTSPQAVLVTFGSVESSLAAQLATTLAEQDVRIGAINVRIYRPFIEEEFLRVLPKSTVFVGVLGQVRTNQDGVDPNIHSRLHDDILPILAYHRPKTQLREMKYPLSHIWNPREIAIAFQAILARNLVATKDEQNLPSLQLLDSSVQQYTFWGIDDSPVADAALLMADALAKDSSQNVTVNTSHDNELQGGTVRVDIRKSRRSLEANHSIEAADTIVVDEFKLLSLVDILRSVKPGGNCILSIPGVKDDDVEKKLPPSFRKQLVQKDISLFLVDSSLGTSENTRAFETRTLQASFLRVALREAEDIARGKLAAVVGDPGILDDVFNDLDKTLREIEIPKSWIDTESDANELQLPINITSNSFVSFNKEEEAPPTQLRTWQKAAKGLLFKEAYNTKPDLRPDLPTKTYTVHVKENRRLTPMTYDRNIFHIEFDLGKSGLKYDIGEALGIHAENDAEEVNEFIKFYGLDPDEVVEIANRDDSSIFENRTVYQSLIQNVDIFGRPPKRFYEALAEFASDENEEKELRVLGGPEGAKEFQRRAEVDTITYADILLEFSSAHPSFHDIVRIVAPMKRREYSIASCQAVTPTSVALMIVVVNWTDTRSRSRFGQATRYLAKLRPGAPVTVSIKPSVMKLPPKATQPLIMAGLGTGLAPFRAFVQHRALEKSQGKEIGAVLLYMGSRHQREEYCYGEEWEAYQAAGVITLLGRAFSRDQPQKIYIQDRMRQTLGDIVQSYIKDDGAFYLCGPTWPVPDVTQVLEEAIAVEVREREGRKEKKGETRREIERLKDVGRYVLEVY